MDNSILTFIFFFAMITSVYFFGKLITWHAYKINPKNFREHISSDSIIWSNVVMFISIILWSIIFYNI